MRVAIADDAVLFREGLVRLLTEAEFEVVGQAADADELLAIVRDAPPSRRPQVTVVDIRMPPSHTTEGLVAAKTIRAEHPEIGVLVLSHYIETEHAMDLLGDGAGGTGTCSRTGSRTSRGSGTRCSGWATAAQRSIPKSSAGCSAAGARRTRWSI